MKPHLHNACGVLAGWAVELVLLQVGHCKQPAALAHMHSVCITLVEQPLLHTDIHRLENRATRHRDNEKRHLRALSGAQ